MAVGIGRGDAGGEKPRVLVQEIDGPKIGRRKRIVRLRVGSVGKYSGVAHVDAGLPAEFRSEGDRVKHRPCEALVEEVGIVEGVLAIGHVIVGGAIEQGIGRIDRPRQRAVAGIDVLIEFLEVGQIRPVLRRQSVFEIVVDEDHRGVHGGPRNVERGAAVVRGQVAVRSERKRRIERRR